MTTDFTGPKLLDQKQAATYLGTTVSTLNSLRYAGKLKDLPYVRFGNRVRYTIADLDAYIATHTIGAKEC